MEITSAQVERLREAVIRYDLTGLTAMVSALVPGFGHPSAPDVLREATVVDFPSREARRTP